MGETAPSAGGSGLVGIAFVGGILTRGRHGPGNQLRKAPAGMAERVG
jgi:hypothetical protein